MSLTDDDKRWIAGELNKLDVKIDRVETTLNDRIERVETTLLTEFHKWASPNEARQRTHTTTIRALELEFEALRERVEKLEHRQ